jgi:uncharacterized protein (DUF2384 family)
MCIFALHLFQTPMQPAYSSRSEAPRPVIDLIRQARKGVLRHRVDEVATQVGLTDIEMARILNMSVRSLHGKNNADTLSLASSERLLLLDRLIQHGIRVFDGKAEVFGRWLRTPLSELAYREGTGVPQAAFSLREAGSFEEPQPTYETETSKLPPPVIPQTPISLLDTVMGFSLVEDVLGRIEWGIVG